MPLDLPPETEKLIPLLKQYLSQRYGLNLPEGIKPFSVSSEDLLKGEKEALLPLLILERLLLENYEPGLFSQNLLKKLFSLENLPGYTFYFPRGKPQNYTFFHLEGPYYFYPLFFGKTAELFMELWQKDKPFRAFFTEGPEIFEQAWLKRNFSLLKGLSFTRLNRKTKSDLKAIFELHEEGLLSEWIKLLKKGKALLVVTETPPTSPLFTKIKPLKFKEGKISFYLFEEKALENLLEELKTFHFVSGIVRPQTLREVPFKGLNPLLLGYAALEHAKRARKPFHLLDGFTLHVLADLFFEWEDLKGALRFYELARPYTLQPVELTLSEASIYYALKDLERAKKILKGKLCGCVKEDPRIHYNLGIIFLEERDFEKAEYHLYKAYLLNPDEPLFRKALLQYLWSQERYEEMEEVLRKVKAPDKVDKIFLGKLAFIRGNYQEALSALQEMLDIKERDGEALYFLAWLYLYFKKDKEAVNFFLKEAERLLRPEELARLTQSLGLPQ